MLHLQAVQLLARCNGNVGAALNSHFDGDAGGGKHSAPSRIVFQGLLVCILRAGSLAAQDVGTDSSVHAHTSADAAGTY